MRWAEREPAYRPDHSGGTRSQGDRPPEGTARHLSLKAFTGNQFRNNAFKM